MDGFLAILRRFDGGFLSIPHELIEGSLLIPHGFDERVAIIPFEIDGGIGFDGGVLIYSPPPTQKRWRDSHSFAII